MVFSSTQNQTSVAVVGSHILSGLRLFTGTHSIAYNACVIQLPLVVRNAHSHAGRYMQYLNLLLIMDECGDLVIQAPGVHVAE